MGNLMLQTTETAILAGSQGLLRGQLVKYEIFRLL
jgi:hypothetical protein